MLSTFVTSLIASATLLVPAHSSEHRGGPPPAVRFSTGAGAQVRDRVSRLERAPGVESDANATVTVGRSVEGRPIRLREYGLHQTDRRILVFGCIHGTECSASEIPDFVYSCPTSGAVFYVPNLNPDGTALGTRLNARGVDLNRNFPASWRATGAPGDLEYPGPRPLSEPETRLATRLIRAIHPDVTIWFHQEAEPMVRAWGPSVAAARLFADDLRSVRYTGVPFRRLPWMAGTAPNWQNHRFPGTSSFVVELPLGSLSRADASAIGAAVARFAGPRPGDL